MDKSSLRFDPSTSTRQFKIDGWVSDRTLQPHMAQMVDRHPGRDEKTWVMYWLPAARKRS